jgi:hypothetical protein
VCEGWGDGLRSSPAGAKFPLPADPAASPGADFMRTTLIAAVLAFTAGTAFAHNCPNEMKAIDAKLATNPKLSDADAAKVKALRADGEAAHQAGKHDESMKLLGEAKKLLGV